MRTLRSFVVALVVAPLFATSLHAVGAGECSGRPYTLDVTRCTTLPPRLGPPQPGLRENVAQRSSPAMDRLTGSDSAGGSSSGAASPAQPSGRTPRGPASEKQSAPKPDTRATQPPKFDSLDKVIQGARVRF